MMYKVSDFMPIDGNSKTLEPCALLNLPAEIRLQIYSYLLPGSTLVLPLRHHKASGQDLYGQSWPEVINSFRDLEVYHVSSKTKLCDLSIFRANKQIYSEAVPLLYSHNIFNVTVRWDGAHILTSSIEKGQPLSFQIWPTSAAMHIHKLHIDIPIISKRTYDRRECIFEAYMDIRQTLRLLIDWIRSLDLRELTVDCFYLAYSDEKEHLPSERAIRSIREIINAFQPLRGLHKAIFRLHILDYYKKILYYVDSDEGNGLLLSLRELCEELQTELTGLTTYVESPHLMVSWATLDQSVVKALRALDEDNRLARLSSRVPACDSDHGRRALQWALDQAWSAADLGDEATFSEARGWVEAALAKLFEVVNQDYDRHHQTIEDDRHVINECFKAVIEEMSKVTVMTD